MVLAALLALAGLCAPAWAADPTFPALTGRVVDAANIIPPDEELRLDQKLAALEAQSRRQLVVATLPSEPCAASPSVANHGSSPAPTAAASAPPSCIA